jgi:hypothetical protein
MPQNLTSTLLKLMINSSLSTKATFPLLFYFFLIHIVEAEVIPNLLESLVCDNNGETTST